MKRWDSGCVLKVGPKQLCWQSGYGTQGKVVKDNFKGPELEWAAIYWMVKPQSSADLGD